jgi:hypothetical protein
VIELWQGRVLPLYLLVLRLLAPVVVDPVAASLLKVLLQNWLDVVLDLLIVAGVDHHCSAGSCLINIGPTAVIIVVIKFCP